MLQVKYIHLVPEYQILHELQSHIHTINCLFINEVICYQGI